MSSPGFPLRFLLALGLAAAGSSALALPPRVANPTLNVPAAPPQVAFSLATAFGGFTNPVALASPPGDTRRLFVCQKGGLLRLVGDVTAPAPSVTTFLDLPALLSSRGESLATNGEQGLLAVAFHPAHAANRRFFIAYSVQKGGSKYQRLSRFTTRATNPNLADPASEVILIEQFDEQVYHNAGDLHFGPDGYLYHSLGDEGGSNDGYDNSQTITRDFFSAILRLDVDLEGDEIAGGDPAAPDDANLPPNPHPAIPLHGGRPAFEVPADNPFVGATSFLGAPVDPALVRTEFWATGFRNPWRMSIDPATGELWVGDVGQGTREEIDLVVKGGNYGWAFREGTHPGYKAAAAPPDFDTLYHQPPIHDYPRSAGNAVVGGIVYRGTRISSLHGAYIFADYAKGNVWSLVRNPTGPPTVTRLTGEVGIAALGRDPSNGDVLLADYGGDILRLTSAPVAGSFPATLSQTGLFSNLADLSPAPSVVPYSVNLPFWSDHALKRRWFAIPDGSSTMSWSRDGSWTFPAGQIWVKHFDLELERGNPATAKRLETRLLVKTASGAYGVSYRWNEAGSDATLVPDPGVAIDVAVDVDGTPRLQRWQIPSRAECMACHTPQAGHALSMDTRQLNLDPGNGNQLVELQQAGYFSKPPDSPNLLPRLVRPDEDAFPIEARVRSYLAANCAFCHRAGGSAAPAEWDGRPGTTLAATGLIDGLPASDSGSFDPLLRLVVPGDSARSILLHRVAASPGFSRMPPFGSNELDHDAIELLTEWIDDELPDRRTYDQWCAEHFPPPPPLALSTHATAPDDDPDADGASNLDEFLALTDPLSGASFLRPRVDAGPDQITVSCEVPANRSVLIECSEELGTWQRWDVPGNHGLPHAGGLFQLGGPRTAARQFFRIRLTEN
jgi:uncharacterized repeat protein (TIGR03806 family)